MGLLDWLFGTNRTQPAVESRPTPISKQAPQVVAVVGGITITATVECREMTSDEVEAAKMKFAAAFDWVIRDVLIRDAEKRKLRDFLCAHWNNSSITKKALEELGVSFEWPSGEVLLRARSRERHQRSVAEIRGQSPHELLSRMKVQELKALMTQHGQSTKGKITKTSLIDSIGTLPEETLQAVSGSIVKELTSRLPDPDVLKPRDVVLMLHGRVSRAMHALRRNNQTLEILDEERDSRRPHFTDILVDAFEFKDRPAPCGLKHGDVRTLKDLEDRLRVPLCEYPECSCTFSPSSAEIRARHRKI